jgi:hypothetical protein
MSKRQKFFLVLAVVFIGGIVSVEIDNLLGISFAGVSIAARLTHVAVIGLWGATMSWATNR